MVHVLNKYPRVNNQAEIVVQENNIKSRKENFYVNGKRKKHFGELARAKKTKTQKN